MSLTAWAIQICCVPLLSSASAPRAGPITAPQGCPQSRPLELFPVLPPRGVLLHWPPSLSPITAPQSLPTELRSVAPTQQGGTVFCVSGCYMPPECGHGSFPHSPNQSRFRAALRLGGARPVPHFWGGSFHNKYGTLALSFLQRELRPPEDERQRGRSLSLILKGRAARVPGCPGQSQFTPIVPVSVLIAPPFPLKSAPVWMINHVSSLFGGGLWREHRTTGPSFPRPCSRHTVLSRQS